MVEEKTSTEKIEFNPVRRENYRIFLQGIVDDEARLRCVREFIGLDPAGRELYESTAHTRPIIPIYFGC